MALARPSARPLFVLVALAFVCLALAFVGNDFSVLYVAHQLEQRAAAALPLRRGLGRPRGLDAAVAADARRLDASPSPRFSRHLPDKVSARILGGDGPGSSFGFLLFMLVTSNPFDRLLPAAADGRDLNPLLQDPGMVIHPPMLYMGYVGFSVAFSFAVAALIGGNLDADLGALDPALDDRGVDLPHPRHRARQRLGLLRARLGRLVVLGSGRERLVHALAGRHRADPFARRHREAQQLQDRGPCCWRSSRSRSRCSAPSWSARACCRRCTRSPPTRGAASSSSPSW